MFRKYVPSMKQHMNLVQKPLPCVHTKLMKRRGNFEMLQIPIYNVLRYLKLFVIDAEYVHVVKDSKLIDLALLNMP